jgi:hypothetical protein
MAWVGRLAGALLVVTEGETYLIGELKEPLNFDEAGFDHPGERDIKVQPITRLSRLVRGSNEGDWRPYGDVFATSLEGQPLLDQLAHFFLIRRNGIVSERLWRLVMESSKLVPSENDAAISTGGRCVDATWLGTTPWPVWEAVRDAVLRC